MATRMGLDAPVGSSARDDESEAAQDVKALEAELQRARGAAKAAKEQHEKALREATRLEIELNRAKAGLFAQEIRAAAMIDNDMVDRTTQEAIKQIRSGAAIVAESGSSAGWGRWIDAPLAKAREAAGADETPAVVVIRRIDQTGSGRPSGVGLFLDLSHKLPQVNSTLTAAETAERSRTRSGS